MIAECEEPISKMKDLKMVKVKTCGMQPRGQKPQCFKAVGKTSKLNHNYDLVFLLTFGKFCK